MAKQRKKSTQLGQGGVSEKLHGQGCLQASTIN
ncbi:hypothetical protein GDO78_017950 [Eleutherodactylus coqui]|uniref:Uncharacterized protein n=1 Tax=Eleutherodactylus coqui TaxID=57060 RepID=A0A8J6BED0_ELECQ|nr:hypothetical protein GDO78_017950 [Eleutherodactylus coqui]